MSKDISFNSEELAEHLNNYTRWTYYLLDELSDDFKSRGLSRVHEELYKNLREYREFFSRKFVAIGLDSHIPASMPDHDGKVFDLEGKRKGMHELYEAHKKAMATVKVKPE